MAAPKCSLTVFVVSLLAAGTDAAWAQTPAFAAGNVTTGTFPAHRAVALADVSGDGKVDLIVARGDNSNNPNDIAILTGNGSGTFAALTTKSIGANPFGIAVGDLNLDGKPDLVVAAENGVRVLIASGGGAFNNATTLSGGTGSPRSAVIGDFNRDGKPDIAAALNSAAQAAIFLATSPGVFAAAATVGAGAQPNGITAGDFNRDGILDLAVANFGSASVTVLTGNGSGGFTGTNFNAGNGAFSIATGDLNRDGRLDLVVANRNANSFSTLLGGASPLFAAATNTSISPGVTPSAIALADVNGDGNLDVVITTEDNDQVRVFSGTEAGAFGGASFSRGVADQPRAVAAGDINGDGRADLMIAGFGSTAASLLVNSTTFNASGTFAAPATITFSQGTGAIGLAPADFNRDGTIDLAVAMSSNTHSSNGHWTLFGSGDGAFAPGIPGFRNLAHFVNATGIAAGDFFRSGTPAVMVTHAGHDIVEIAYGADAFLTLFPGPGSGDHPRAIATGDFNRDGYPDSAIANTNSDNVSVISGNGFGATSFTVGASQQPVDIAAGDIDGNGTTDLAVANQSGSRIAILYGDGAGSFGAPASVPVTGGAFAVALGDFNGDSRLDLAAASNGVVYIMLASGAAGSFAAPVPYGVGAFPQSLAVADFNRDGKLDLAAANYVSGSVSVLPGIGDGTFGTKADYAVGSGPKDVVAADFNRDGRVDLAVANNSANTLSILLNGGFTLNVTRAGTGTGSVSGTAIDCGTDCAQFYETAATVTLTAAANPGSFLASWSDPACSAPAPCTVSVITNTTLTATFSQTSLSFTDEPIVAGTTIVKAVHLTELQQGVNTARQNRGLPPVDFAPVTRHAVISRADIVALRDAIDAIYDALSRARPGYTDPAITAQSTPARAAHIMELRWALASVQ